MQRNRGLTERTKRGTLTGGGDRPHQRAHLFDTPLSDMPQGHLRHDRQGQADAGGHFRRTPNEMALETDSTEW